MKTKILSLLVIVSSVLTMISCDQETLNVILDPINITHRTQDYEFEINVEDIIGSKKSETPIYETTVSINLDSILNTQDGMGAVENAMIKEIVLGINTPEDLNFDFAKSARVTISMTQAIENDVVVAQINDVPVGLTVLTLDVVEENKDQISEILQTGNFWIRVYADYDGIPQTEATLIEAYFNALIEMTLNVS
ncbi:MAG: hypothetical protein JEZ03_02440 [Bacteroidales bacterium]|nr:hypothetical protein [Bacteroidales bacterium]